jgi:hypothetical protein
MPTGGQATRTASLGGTHLTTTVSAESTSPPFLERISAGQHSLQADDPVSAGGQDNGLSPYEFLLASLGSPTTHVRVRSAGPPGSSAWRLGTAISTRT